MAFATAKFRQAFGGLFAEFADNWVDLVVDATRERLKIQGFRVGDGPDTDADTDAERIWRVNGMDAESQLGITESLVSMCSYTMVWPGMEGADPEITVEHPSQVITAYEPGGRRRLAAGYKEWSDDVAGRVFATLYRPDVIYKFQSKQGTRASSATISWEPRTLEDEPWPLPNPLGEVPIVPWPNRPRILSTGGQSEIAKVIPVQDAINKLVADMMVASEFGAFRQRWATGIEIPIDPETKQPVDTLKSAMDRVWTSRNIETKFGEFGQTDLHNFVTAIEMLVQHVASQTRTPPHYFYLRGEFPSGESLRSAETGLVAKVRDKMLFYGVAAEDTMRLAFRAMDDERGHPGAPIETIWADPESRIESVVVDAAVKKQTLGVPKDQLWEDMGYSPEQRARFRRAGELLPPEDTAGLDTEPPIAGGSRSEA